MHNMHKHLNSCAWQIYSHIFFIYNFYLYSEQEISLDINGDAEIQSDSDDDIDVLM